MTDMNKFSPSVMRSEEELENHYEVMLAALWEVANGHQCDTLTSARELAKSALDLIGNPEPINKWNRVKTELPRYDLIVDDSIKDEFTKRLYQTVQTFYCVTYYDDESLMLIKSKLLEIVNNYKAMGLIEGTPAIELRVPESYAFPNPPACTLQIDLYSTTPT